MLFNMIKNADENMKENKKCIVYKADGNGVKTTQKSLINLSLIFNNICFNEIYAEYTKDVVIIYRDFGICLELVTLYNDIETERIYNALKDYIIKISSYAAFERFINNQAEDGQYIKNDILYLLKYKGSIYTLNKARKAKNQIIQARAEAEAEERAQKEREAQKRAEAENAEKERIGTGKTEFLKGFGNGKTQIQIDKIYNILSKIQGYQNGEKIEYKNRRDFIIDIFSAGGRAEKKENIISYYCGKQSKPKTEYRLYTKENQYYIITKTEFDFANYIKNNMEV